MTSGGLHVGDDRYLIGDSWWVFAIVAVISVVAVFRLGMGRRDWLATFAASGWVAIGAGYAIGTDQYGLLALSALILFLVGTGTVRDRRALGGD